MRVRSHHEPKDEFQACVLEALGRANEKFLEVLGLAGAREVWLLAELAIALQKGGFAEVETNRRIPEMGRKQFDLWCAGPPAIIAELKVVGGSYYTKNIDGWSTSPQSLIHSYCHQPITRQNAEYNEREGSIVRDCAQLWAAPNTYDKHMILIIPDDGIDGPIGQVLTKMNFEGEHFQQSLSGFRVRMWKL